MRVFLERFCVGVACQSVVAAVALEIVLNERNSKEEWLKATATLLGVVAYKVLSFIVPSVWGLGLVGCIICKRQPEEKEEEPETPAYCFI